MENKAPFSIEVVALWPEQLFRSWVLIETDLTAQQVLTLSGVFNIITLEQPVMVGSYGKKINDPATYIVQPEDRLELYRPLKVDPKQARKLRAARYPVGRAMRRKR